MEEEIKKTCEILKSGGTILYPTDTIWGIGCDATNLKAVEKVFEIKKRSDSKSFIILVDTAERLKLYVKEVPDIAWDLISSYKNPLTIIYPEARNLAKNVIAGDGTVGIRIANDEFCQKLIEKFGKPIVSTSANISGEITPYFYNKIPQEIINSVDFVVNLHKNRLNQVKPSTIIKINLSGDFQILRQ